MHSWEVLPSRPVHGLGEWWIGEWRMKLYAIACGPDRPRAELIDAAKRVTVARLMEGGGRRPKYKVGFVGVHDRTAANVVFVEWWAAKNKLKRFTYISPAAHPQTLRMAEPDGRVADLWDRHVRAFERKAWRNTVADPALPDVDAYFKLRCSTWT